MTFSQMVCWVRVRLMVFNATFNHV